MLGRCQRLQQKHPEMGHEVSRDPVIRVIKKNSHVLVRLKGPQLLREGIHKRKIKVEGETINAYPQLRIFRGAL